MLKKILILAEPRSGTNALISRLNKVPEILCHYELFHGKRVFTAGNLSVNMRDIQNKNYDLRKRDRNPLVFLQNLIDDAIANVSQIKLFGFKLFYDHNKLILNHLLDDSDWIKIIIFRANILDQYISDKLAHENNEYILLENNGKKDTPKIQKKVKFNLHEFTSFVDQKRRIINYYMSNARGKVFFLEFFQAVKGDMDWVEQIIDVRNSQYLKSSPATKQQNPIETEKKILNFDEMLKFIKDTEFKWMTHFK